MFCYYKEVNTVKYKFVFCPGHPGVNSKGYIYEHILVVEKMLGRFLKSEEVVHHIDENKSNNIPNNLMVFATDADHTRFHRLDKSHRILYCIPVPILKNKKHCLSMFFYFILYTI